MKQGKKYYLKWMAVIGGVLCGAGLLVAGAAFAAMGFRFDSYVYSSVPEEKVESFTFTGMRLNLWRSMWIFVISVWKNMTAGYPN